MIDVLLLFYEPTSGGQATHVLALAKGLDKARFRIIVAYPEHHVMVGNALKEYGIASLPLPMRRLNNAAAGVELLRLLRKNPVDILHVHGHEAGMWARLVGLLARVPANVYTPHTIHSGVLGERIYLGVERALARCTDAWISVNNCDRIALVGIGIPRAKISTIHNGIDAAALKHSRQPVTRWTCGIPEDVSVVLQAGRISVQKGPAYFVNAAARVLERNQNVRFVLVGEGPQRAEMERLATSLGVASHILFVGWREDAVELMGCADVVVLSSLWEGLPYALLEAMAVGKPVIATAVGGNPEIVENGTTGLLVPPRAETALAEAILTLIGDAELARRMGVAGRRRVLEHFSVEKMVRLTEEVYERSLA